MYSHTRAKLHVPSQISHTTSFTNAHALSHITSCKLSLLLYMICGYYITGIDQRWLNSTGHTGIYLWLNTTGRLTISGNTVICDYICHSMPWIRAPCYAGTYAAIFCGGTNTASTTASSTEIHDKQHLLMHILFMTKKTHSVSIMHEHAHLPTHTQNICTPSTKKWHKSWTKLYETGRSPNSLFQELNST